MQFVAAVPVNQACGSNSCNCTSSCDCKAGTCGCGSK
ncbi:hypothetical protein MPER_06082 [Moniliophthora perniciosa FA553]|nr:hypothetical protein MPER_06082 [Moniliophthora perniciosa FA553]